MGCIFSFKRWNINDKGTSIYGKENATVTEEDIEAVQV